MVTLHKYLTVYQPGWWLINGELRYLEKGKHKVVDFLDKEGWIHGTFIKG